MADDSFPTESRIVESLLDRIASGESHLIGDLLAFLADVRLCTPISQVEDLSDPRGTNRVSVATFSQGAKKLVPAFSNEEIFLEWSAGRYQCFSVPGADLAMSLPEGTDLIINPGQPSYFELSRDQLEELKRIDTSSLQTANYQTVVSEAAARPEPQTIEFDQEATLEATVLDLEALRTERDENWQPPKLAERSKLPQELRSLFADFIEVEEAYFQDLGDDLNTPAVLGLLCSGLDAERRFTLFDRLAELSKKFYGIAGAIEVFDDLDLKASNSWELFKSLPPVYSSDPAFRADVFNKAAEKSDSDTRLKPSVERKPTNTWQSVRKSGSKVLSAFRGESESEN